MKFLFKLAAAGFRANFNLMLAVHKTQIPITTANWQIQEAAITLNLGVHIWGFSASVQEQYYARVAKCLARWQSLLLSSRSTLDGAPLAACSLPSCHGAFARVCGPPATWQLRWGWGRGGARLLQRGKEGWRMRESKHEKAWGHQGQNKVIEDIK